MVRLLSIIMGVLILTSASCFAMQMSQPVDVGEAVYSLVNGKLKFTGATKSNQKNAVFGTGNDALYVYGAEKGPSVDVGGKDRNNTIRVGALGLHIYKINTDSGITFYALRDAYDLRCNYIIIGRGIDGKFVKYLDLNDVAKRYYDTSHRGILNSGLYIFTVKDSLYIDLCEYNPKSTKYPWPGNQIARFQFKWDDQKQWFGVNKI